MSARRRTVSIGDTVIEFCVKRTESGEVLFHMEELVDHIAHRNRGKAPDSPSRLLRQLRDRGKLRCPCIDRPKSLYQIQSINGVAVQEAAERLASVTPSKARQLKMPTTAQIRRWHAGLNEFIQLAYHKPAEGKKVVSVQNDVLELKAWLKEQMS